MDESGTDQSLVRRLARQRASAGSPPQTRYDSDRAISLVLEDGAWVESYRSRSVPMSKKGDIETGEDQKSQ